MYYATSPEDFLSAEILRNASGAEALQKIVTGDFAHPPFARIMGLRMIEVTKGRVVFEGIPGFEHLNPAGTVHGGWYGGIMDSCMSCAVQSALPAGQTYTTLEYKINLLRPLFGDGVRVLGEGISSHAGRRTATAEGKLVGAEDGKLYATGSVTCMIFDL